MLIVICMVITKSTALKTHPVLNWNKDSKFKAASKYYHHVVDKMNTRYYWNDKQVFKSILTLQMKNVAKDLNKIDVLQYVIQVLGIKVGFSWFSIASLSEFIWFTIWKFKRQTEHSYTGYCEHKWIGWFEINYMDNLVHY